MRLYAHILNRYIGKIQKIISIRNAFAHIPITKSATIIIKNVNRNLKMELEEVVSELEVMNSSGDIKTRSAKELVEVFDLLTDEINIFLDSVIDENNKNIS